MSDNQLFKLAAFAEVDGGGNPAGVWVGDALPEEGTMQRQAKQVGYSETAFVAPASGSRRTVRYFSPEMEVPFCGHATIATGVVLGRLTGEGTYTLKTQAGDVAVTVTVSGERAEASLVSVEPQHDSAVKALVSDVLPLLGWSEKDLDSDLPPARAYAGAWHLVLAVAKKESLDALDYDFDALKSLMLREGLVTLQLVWRASDSLYHSRNPFPVGGVVEDPATGAAAAAFGGYLRDAGLVSAPTRITLRQGEKMGRPSVLRVDIPASGGITVSGTAVDIVT